MSATAAAAGRGVVNGMMRQRTAFPSGGPVLDKSPSSVLLPPTAHTRRNTSVHSEQSQLVNVDLVVGGAEGAGRQFHTPTGAQLQFQDSTH